MTPISADQVRQMLENGEPIDVRADGKAGAGLVTTMEILSQTAARELGLQVQEWPLFSSARKGANVRAFLRLAKSSIKLRCQVDRPHVAALFTEATGRDLDFAAGTESAVYVVNSPRGPREVAAEFGLSGEVITIDGDRLGAEHLGRPIPNMAMLAPLAIALGLGDPEAVGRGIERVGAKRRLPPELVTKNLACYRAALTQMNSALVETAASAHRPPAFDGYRNFPVGGQSALRSSVKRRTTLASRTDARIAFSDAARRCTGCGLCVFHCPEGILKPVPDPKTGIRVIGMDQSEFCKMCRECVETCPVDLFSEVPV